MSYDLLIGLNQSKLNQAISQIYSKSSLRNKLFKGNQSGNFQGTAYKVNWSVDKAPEFELRSPTSAEWAGSISSKGTPAAPRGGTFIINLPKLSINIDAKPQGVKTSAPVKVICTATTRGTRLKLNALAVVVKLSGSPLDQWVVQSVLVPAILTMVNASISGISMPAPSFSGIRLTPPVVQIKNPNMLIAFNLVKDGTPSISGPIPNDPFFMLMSKELLNFAVDYEVRRNIQGKSFSKNGRESGGGFAASYNAHARINGISAQVTSNPTRLKAKVSVDMSASAGIDTPAGYIIKGGKVVIDTIGDTAKKVGNALNPSKW